MTWFWMGLIVLGVLVWMRLVAGRWPTCSLGLRWPLAWRATVESRERTFREQLDLLQAKSYKQRVEAAQAARDFVGKFVRLVARHDERDRAYVLQVELDDRLLLAVGTHGQPKEWEYLRRRLAQHVEAELEKLNYVAFQRRDGVLPYRRP